MFGRPITVLLLPFSVNKDKYKRL